MVAFRNQVGEHFVQYRIANPVTGLLRSLINNKNTSEKSRIVVLIIFKRK